MQKLTEGHPSKLALIRLHFSSRARVESEPQPGAANLQAGRAGQGRHLLPLLEEGCLGVQASVQAGVTLRLGWAVPAPPTPAGQRHPQRKAVVSQSPITRKIVMASFRIVIATTLFSVSPAFYCVLDGVRWTSGFPTPATNLFKGCPSTMAFFN